MPEQTLYTTKQIRICEHKASAELGLSADNLMESAGLGAFTAFLSLFGHIKSIAVFCGGGNNAGDGYVFARLAWQHGIAVIVYQYKTADDLPPAARHAALAAITAGVPCQLMDESIDSDVELIVDALLGIGLIGLVNASAAQTINLINDSGLPVLAIDIPSGLDADTGRVLGVCVKATVTVTFIAAKVGMYSLDGPDSCGKIICEDLQLQTCLATLKPAATLLDKHLLTNALLARKKNSHKGMYGHVLVIGGGLGMPGAAHLAALAALRVGAGMVTVATRPEYAHSVLPLLPEAMIYGINTIDDLMPLLGKATTCIIGPGLGEDEWAKALFLAAIAAQLPLVIDASALRMLAEEKQHDDNWIMTPHPGEAASLLACSVTAIQQDRLNAAQQIQQQYGGAVVLKGAGTIVHTAEHEVGICAAGNPGMASAGMGDVLSGVIAGLLAQGLTITAAAKLGVWLHAQAADDAARERGPRGMIATDLMCFLQRRVNA